MVTFEQTSYDDKQYHAKIQQCKYCIQSSGLFSSHGNSPGENNGNSKGKNIRIMIETFDIHGQMSTQESFHGMIAKVIQIGA